jgi:hypothetical protein
MAGKKDKVAAKAAELQQSPTGDRKVTSPKLPCGATPKKVWHHLGLTLEVAQYDIDKRSMGLNLPSMDHPKPDTVDPLHELKSAAAELKPGGADDTSLLKIRPPKAGQGFLATLTTGGNALREESGCDSPTLHLDGKACTTMNRVLGKALGIHIERTGVYSPFATERGLWYLRNPEDKPMATEKLGLKLYVYLRLELGGAKPAKIYEVDKGLFTGTVVSDKDYEDRKFMRKLYGSTDSGGAMPLMPGVYHVHVLLEAAGADFHLVEAHCDGDRLA